MDNEQLAGANPVGAPVSQPAPPAQSTEDLLNGFLAECLGLARNLAVRVPDDLFDRGDGTTITLDMFSQLVAMGNKVGQTLATLRGERGERRHVTMEYVHHDASPPPPPENGPKLQND